ncbi:MAG: aldehyde dehydrogenase family protein [Candidatus Korobacteraceae bacterium]
MTAATAQTAPSSRDERSVAEARELMERAYAAFLKFQEYSQEQVDGIIDAMAAAATAEAEKLARMAVEETGYGVGEHKVQKNLFSSQRVYEATRGLKTVGIVREDSARGILEIAVPVGVVAAILPSTNPTSTAIYKVLIALKGRNSIVLSPHPTALRCSCETAAVLKRAAISAGAPEDVICCFNTPSMAGTQELMRHRRTAVILATGGMGMVRAAYSSGKPAFGVGPGNVPAMIDRTADIEKAVADVVHGKTFDNGTICSSEQAIVAEEGIREPVLKQLERNGAHFLNAEEIAILGREMVNLEAHTINPKFVGKSAVKVAELAGIRVAANTRVLVAKLEGVGREHPLSAEKLSPVLALYFTKDRGAAMETCRALLRFGGLGHTCSIHARDEQVIREYGLKMPAYRVVVNSPSPQGSIGSSTNLFPAMTLGCGAAGGNITSDNISPLHLINLKRVAYEARPVTRSAVAEVAAEKKVQMPATPLHDSATATACGCGVPSVPVPSGGLGSDPVQVAISRAVERFVAGRRTFAELAAAPSPEAPAPKPQAAVLPAIKKRPVEFVSEAEVRAALKQKEKILVGRKTIITPAAKDLAAQYDVFARED